ncbi:MAG: toprim domain-containing protein [Myxococcales bacterium]|nr:toprim domain-containing protein [Myxococcales bacterium]
MTDWVNFAEVRSRVSLETVLLSYYGITNLKRDGTTLVGPCPVHGGDSPRAFHANLEKNVWHCFSRCQSGGNQLDLVAKKEGIGIREAALRVQAHFLGDAPLKATPNGAPRTPATPAPRGGQAPSEPGRNPPLDLELQLSHEHPHLTDARGLAPDVIRAFGVGYCARGILRGMIAIPVHDERGTLVAYAGRRLRPEEIREDGKYKFPKGFRKELVLYNLHRVEGRDRVIVVEGFFSVMTLCGRGVPEVVATMGAHLSEPQADLLARFPEVVFLYDGDEAGRLAADKARDLLGDRTVVRIARLPPGTEPEDLTPRALRFILAGLRELDLAELAILPRTPRAPSP